MREITIWSGKVTVAVKKYSLLILISLVSFCLGILLTVIFFKYDQGFDIDSEEKALGGYVISDVKRIIDQGFENKMGDAQWTTLYKGEEESVVVMKLVKGINMHRHRNEDHHLYIISGRAKSITLEGEAVLKEGDYIHFPKEEVHSLEVLDDKPIIFLQVTRPSFSPDDIIWY